MSNAVSNRRSPRIFRKHYAIPGEHGAWIWLLGPLVIGTAAGGQPDLDFLLLLLMSLAIFMLRHPATIAVKVLSGRRGRDDLQPALFWVALYALIALAAFLGLALRGYPQLLLLAVPGLPVFVWHLILVSRRSERDQPGVEIVATGVLSLGAPAAYWVSGGESLSEALVLWVLTWLYSAASIVYVYLRLKQRRWEAAPNKKECLSHGTRTLMYQGFNLTLSLILALAGMVPPLVIVAFLFSALEALEGVLRPAVQSPPTSIGYRQLASSIVFVGIMVLAYLL